MSCTALAVLGSEHVRTTAIRTTVAGDQDAIRDFVASNLTTADVDGSASSPTRRAELDRELDHLAESYGYRHAAVALADGAMLAGDAATTTPTIDAARRSSAASGQPTATISESTGGSPALTEAIPISVNGVVQLVVTLERDATFVTSAGDEAWRDVLLITGFATVILALLLRAIFHAAGLRLRRQAHELLESRRRDPVTGLINHGATAARLTEVLATATTDGSSVGIALVDIDNFRLLNETYGSPAGDEALLLVARALEAESAPWEALGRFGPDEFLAVAPAAVARDLPAVMKRVHAALDSASLQFEGSERLPLTISVGVTYFPFHATGANELLSAATIALGEAKAGGGNRTVIADAWTSEPKAAQSTFDVFQGLVVAIDNKDRYTKRHSEDVACYALFLAARIELSEGDRAVLRTAGLLHDIGKIGIPDDILRKPGRLSPYEYEIVKQHVALGDLIVRDLPEIELVRAGVRHHHERWDGQGYLDRLEGEQIPLFARILAVGDAFSAMTTTRPYRKALSVQQALDELRAAAGTQLDPELVRLFVDGIEQDPDAPMPGADRNGTQLWTPTTRAA
ncbi:MAG TPA: diguanylate cyclase [Candidatus Limnocylindrales bacterium]|nr:diguanylate cyclase [Candidatus Limnocylindrales bacterium]